jgi:hypothetical protein
MLAPSWILIEYSLLMLPHHLMLALFVLWAMRVMWVRPRVGRLVLLAILCWCVGEGIYTVSQELSRMRIVSIPHESIVYMLISSISYLFGWGLILLAFYEQYFVTYTLVIEHQQEDHERL